MKLLTLSGSPTERGRIHGEDCRTEIHELVGGWRYAIERSTGRLLSEWVQDFKAHTSFDAAMHRYAPGLVEELQGIAEGASIDFDELYMFNCTDENQWFLEHRSSDVALPEPRGCSSLGTTRDLDVPVIAQNMDIPGATDGHQLLLHIVEDDKETYLFTISGMLGMIGLNNKGVGVVNNSLRQLSVRPDGLPVNAMTRGLLMQDTFEQSVDYISNTPHATGHNWILGGPTGVADFECSANLRVRVADKEGRVTHTNHPLCSDDLNDHPAFRTSNSTSNTETRLHALECEFEEKEKVDLQTIRDALSSHRDPENPVCRHVTDKKTNFTAASVIYELSENPVLHIAPGPPCEVPYQTYRFG